MIMIEYGSKLTLNNCISSNHNKIQLIFLIMLLLE
jgi:hypothetical protein